MLWLLIHSQRKMAQGKPHASLLLPAYHGVLEYSSPITTPAHLAHQTPSVLEHGRNFLQLLMSTSRQNAGGAVPVPYWSPPVTIHARSSPEQGDNAAGGETGDFVTLTIRNCHTTETRFLWCCAVFRTLSRLFHLPVRARGMGHEVPSTVHSIPESGDSNG